MPPNCRTRFSAFVYVADEEEGVAKLDVLRLGHAGAQDVGYQASAIESVLFKEQAVRDLLKMITCHLGRPVLTAMLQPLKVPWLRLWGLGYTHMSPEPQPENPASRTVPKAEP